MRRSAEELKPIVERATKWAIDGQPIVRELFERSGRLDMLGFVLATFDPATGEAIPDCRTVMMLDSTRREDLFMEAVLTMVERARALGAIVAWSDEDRLTMVFHALGGSYCRTWHAPIEAGRVTGAFVEAYEA